MRNREGKSGQLAEYDQKWKHSLATVTQTKTKVIKTFKKGGGDNNNNKTLCLCLSGLGLSGDGVTDLLYPKPPCHCAPRAVFNLSDSKRSGQVKPHGVPGSKSCSPKSGICGGEFGHWPSRHDSGRRRSATRYLNATS